MFKTAGNKADYQIFTLNGSIVVQYNNTVGHDASNVCKSGARSKVALSMRDDSIRVLLGVAECLDEKKAQYCSQNKFGLFRRTAILLNSLILEKL